ncbi:hypothetical protein EVAR_48661_1 [Eumeta japonica]|uniref:Uncharacterized protein n=1 Tax=Eumeta variegata TaxID=151549 RepID=A0A4C1X959_EUMVA|nr:hypothetical protein EVAR_48661_1 [Eumeta japonica]
MSVKPIASYLRERENLCLTQGHYEPSFIVAITIPVATVVGSIQPVSGQSGRNKTSYPSNRNKQPGHTFDCSPDSTSVFDPSSGLRLGPGPAFDLVPIRYYSSRSQFSAPPRFDPDFATNHNPDLDEAKSKD